MSERVRRRRGGVFFPLLLVGIGLVLLLNNLGVTDWSGWDIAAKGWPILVIAMGLDLALRRDGIITPILLCGLGVAALLSTLGTWQWDMVGVAARYWPVLVIAIGVDVFVSRPASVGALIGVLPGIVGVAALVWFLGGVGHDASVVETRTISQPLPAASAADIGLRPIAGSLRVAALREGGFLVTGTAGLTRGERVDESVSVSGGTVSYTLVSQGSFSTPTYIGSGERWYWDLKVAQDVPLTLSTTMVAGATRLDLTGLEVERFVAETVFGETYVVLPRQGTLSGKIDGVVGSTVIVVPAGLAVRIEAGSLIGGVDVPADFHRDGDVYTSPGYESATQRVDVEVDQLMGGVEVRYERG